MDAEQLKQVRQAITSALALLSRLKHCPTLDDRDRRACLMSQTELEVAEEVLYTMEPDL